MVPIRVLWHRIPRVCFILVYYLYRCGNLNGMLFNWLKNTYPWTMDVLIDIVFMSIVRSIRCLGVVIVMKWIYRFPVQIFEWIISIKLRRNFLDEVLFEEILVVVVNIVSVSSIEVGEKGLVVKQFVLVSSFSIGG